MNRFAGTRTGYVTLLAAILACGLAAECAAADDEARAAHHAAQKHQPSEAMAAAPVVQPQGGPGPMRYYGGPKSPMWRAPASN